MGSWAWARWWCWPETASGASGWPSSTGSHGAARAEQAAVELHSLLGNVRVDDVMTPDPVTVPADLTVEALIGHFVGLYRCSAFPVMSSDAPARGRGAEPAARRPRPPQGHDHGGPGGDTLDRVVTARPGEPIVSLLARFTPATGRRALVLDHGVLVGIVTASDLDRALELASRRPGAIGPHHRDLAGPNGPGARPRRGRRSRHGDRHDPPVPAV